MALYSNNTDTNTNTNINDDGDMHMHTLSLYPPSPSPQLPPGLARASSSPPTAAHVHARASTPSCTVVPISPALNYITSVISHS